MKKQNKFYTPKFGVNIIFTCYNVNMKNLLWKIELVVLILTVLALGTVCACSPESPPQTYVVNYFVSDGGTIQGKATQSVLYNENATEVTAIPNEGYKFVSWSDGVTTATRVDSGITSALTVTANFKKLSYTVNYLTDGNGTIQGKVTQSVLYNENATEVTAIANEGYKFVAWSDGVKTATRTDENVKSDITVTAEFEKLVYQVNYETSNPIYGTLIEENEKYDVIRIKYQVAYGEDTPIVRAYVRQNELGEDFAFLYWSDGVETIERQDTNITSDLTVTAYFGYKIVYKVNGNVGGRIEGNTEQKLLPNGKTEQVTAIPAQGYVFCGWSDLSWETSRSGDSAVLNYLLNYSAVWEYVAYFEPIEKSFHYNYNDLSGMPLDTQITLNRNNIQAANFIVPKRDGYKFCGWYADPDYKIRITTESGRYMYGYAAFSLETDTLYAKWQKVGMDTDNHKILLVFVDEVETELYSSKLNQTVSIYSKMPAIDYEMGKWIAETIYTLLNEWFAGKVVFEVDCYFTTEVVTDGFSSGRTSFGMIDYCLYADGIQEISSTLAYDYHNTITITGLDDYARYLIAGNGTAGIKNAAVYREIFFMCATADLYHKYLANCKNGKINLNYTAVETCLHELTHTAEMYYEEGQHHCLHKAIGYAINKYSYSNMLNTIKPCLLGEFEMNGEMCGVPMEYWKHQIPIHVGYVCRPVDQRTVGRIVVVGEEEDPDRPPWVTGIGRYLVYGSAFSVQAIPNDGYRFVRWSDGITTAIRHDVNIIAYFRVEAIFEKI